MIGYFKTVGAPASNLDYEGVQTIVHAEHVKNLCSQVAAGDNLCSRGRANYKKTLIFGIFAT